MKRYPYTMALLMFGAITAAVQAEIYKYVDENGQVTYSNTPIKGAKKLDLGIYNQISGPRVRGGKSNGSAAPINVGPSDFPRVDGDTQRKRDTTRRGILEDELRGEEKLLADARKNLDELQVAKPGEDATRRLEKMGKAREAVSNHESNINAIRRELSNIR
ncbi:hypothetical protein HNQ59_003385 [Chitinivorax tropicus]|uniref:DUF4124 domain-containing protein n=1 Tax=Chitinivorax tropicus TaxID=714531 RepID=A0A840MTG2_9PROT|nr:DUF4124 domain-containing protein [Chitinivorax tropicus]MBB5020072.1 hypothetical protein [Chitinivorax tropicus]